MELSARARLLDRVADHLLAHGVAGFTLRGVATAVGSNNRMLLYYFGSKEELILAAVEHAVERFPLLRHALEHLDAPRKALATRLDDTWRAISAEPNVPFMRLFFELFGLAAHQRGRFGGYLDDVGRAWGDVVSAAFRRDGHPAASARRRGTEVVALWRGLQMDLLSTGDRDRIDRVHREAVRRIAATG